MTTPNERAERERIRKRAARQGFKLRTDRDGFGFVLLNKGAVRNLWHFQDLADVAEELRVRAL